MPYTDAAKSTMLTALAGVITHLSVHTSAAVPTTGGNEATGGSPAYARKVPAFSTPSAGVLPLTTALVFDVPAGTYRYIGAWNGSTFLAYGQLPVDRVKTGQDTVTVNAFSPDLNH